MIRAHLATFPPREGIFRKVVAAILPQVDRLFIVFNGYAAVPADIAETPRITAIVPDRDLRDAGKFRFAPAPDDIVFLIDDDLAYPADYVARTMDRASAIGWGQGIFGYLGFTPERRGDGQFRWGIHYLREAKAAPQPASMLGTGAVVARGDLLPPLSEVEPYHGAVDVGLARWAARRGVALTMLPRAEGWLSQRLPRELAGSSLHKTDSRNPRPLVRAALAELAALALPWSGALSGPLSRGAVG